MLAGSSSGMGLEVSHGAEQAVEVVSESRDGRIAACAEESTDDVCFMAMVYANATIAAAYLASTVVSGRNTVECSLTNSVAAPEIMPPFTLFGVHYTGAGGGCSGPSPPAAACSPGGGPGGGAAGGGGGGGIRYEDGSMSRESAQSLIKAL